MTVLIAKQGVHHLVADDAAVRFFRLDDENSIATRKVEGECPNIAIRRTERWPRDVVKADPPKVAGKLTTRLKFGPYRAEQRRVEVPDRVRKFDSIPKPDHIPAR